MELMTFRVRKDRMLIGLDKKICDEVNKRIELTLSLLGTEVMSQEGLAIIISQVIIENEEA